MPDAPTLLLFIAACWLLNLTPGPDVLYIVSSSLRHGLRAGMAAALGIVTGCFVHVLAAGLGVGALLAASSTAFQALKWMGAVYLLWMGVRLLHRPDGSLALDAGSAPQDADLRQVFRRGFLTNVLNPKVALFFLAFVPQFIAADAGHALTAFLLLGMIFVVSSLPINFGYAWLAAWARCRLGVVERAMAWLDRAAGLMFLGFGLRLALADNPSK